MNNINIDTGVYIMRNTVMVWGGERSLRKKMEKVKS